jgi:hypothetical protein
MSTILLATDQGLVRATDTPDTWTVTGRFLPDTKITSVIAREGVILAGTEDGVQRSDDGGQSWYAVNNGLAEPHIRWLAYHPDISDREFAGTEPAGIFISHDGARSWRAVAEVARLRDRYNWYLPYSPAAGCVRGFAFHGDRLYAAVEVGGVLRSDNGGATWALAPGSDGIPRFGRPVADHVHPDVHAILVHPADANQVLAPTGGGLYHSADGGTTWRCLYDCYCRAAWWDPADARHIIFGPAAGVSRQGRIAESIDGGQTWQPAGQGLATPWPQHMVERFTAHGEWLFAVLSNGELLVTTISPRYWQPVRSVTGRVHAVIGVQ